jgi:hypothetical protein
MAVDGGDGAVAATTARHITRDITAATAHRITRDITAATAHRIIRDIMAATAHRITQDIMALPMAVTVADMVGVTIVGNRREYLLAAVARFLVVDQFVRAAKRV